VWDDLSDASLGFRWVESIPTNPPVRIVFTEPKEPEITSVDTATVPLAGGTISVQGSNLDAIADVTLVTCDGVPVPFYNPDDTLNIDIPAGPAGPVTIRVVNDGQRAIAFPGLVSRA
jgi:IPT/TIG domain